MFDFISLVGNSRLYNFHSHTQFCDGRATMAEFAEEAVKQNFTHYGFSPHSPLVIESSCNMSHEDVMAYLDEVERIKIGYGQAHTLFFASMEIDYLDHRHGPATAYYQELPLDYRIGSVHFIPSQDGEYIDIDGCYDNFRLKMAKYFREDIRYVVNTFFDQSLEMLSSGGFDIIGHYDKIGHNASHYKPGIEQEAWYLNRLDEFTDEIISSGVTVEINTKAWADHHRMFPSPMLWAKLLSAGVPVIVNSDAHWPHLINASRFEAFRMLDAVMKI